MLKQKLKVGFAGTPEFAGHILTGLINAELKPDIVLTQPDRASGRGRSKNKKPAPSAVKRLATAHDIPILQPDSLKGEQSEACFQFLKKANLDVLVVAAYGLILPSRFLNLPTFGCLNVHASLLPKWRGAAPIERSIMAGDPQSGVSIMKMDAGMDTGPVYRSYPCVITKEETGDSLHDKLASLGASAAVECLQLLNRLAPVAQDVSAVSYAPKLKSGESLLDWHLPAFVLERQIRALYSRQPAYSFLQAERVRILAASASNEACGTATEYKAAIKTPGTILNSDKSGCTVACGEGWLKISAIQLARGKGKPMAFATALNGFPQLFQSGRFENAN